MELIVMLLNMHVKFDTFWCLGFLNKTIIPLICHYGQSIVQNLFTKKIESLS